MNKDTNSIKLAFILPNLFTASSAFVGVLSIIKASQGRFESAAWLIILALILDGLDGRVARLTNTTSKFGLEFDSLADIIAFGTAPALLLFFYVGEEYGRFGVLVSGLYVVFGAIRLARFNVMTSQTEPSVFIGVPIPTAAVILSVWILLFLEYPFLKTYSLALLLAALVVSILMVSNIRYPSFKKLNHKKANMLKIFVVLLIALSVLFLFPIEGTAVVITAYAFFGPLRALLFLFKRKTNKNSLKD